MQKFWLGMLVGWLIVCVGIGIMDGLADACMGAGMGIMGWAFARYYRK